MMNSYQGLRLMRPIDHAAMAALSELKTIVPGREFERCDVIKYENIELLCGLGIRKQT